ncbi:hypothetical protein [Microbispora bryophytorum]|uniref:hypothetical protein n=1 Tax=Microbispora bryophytorum TaxID=1460882 RepID=UPI0033C39118
MSAAETIIGIAAGLAANEFFEVCPWAAQKIVTWSARLQYGRSPRAEVRAEELAALIDCRPGKLFKLLTALAFAVGASSLRLRREALFWLLYLGAYIDGQVFSIPPLRSARAAGYARNPVEPEVLASEVEARLVTMGLDADRARTLSIMAAKQVNNISD